MRIQTHPAYRPDIDGLRAIAVLSVVFFHAFPSVLTGGFVGVDVFFVISGFLITGILYRESQLGQVSLKSFYSKRVRRIFPALLLVLVFSLVIGWIALTSDEYTQLTRHGAAGAAFLSNVVFWRESGYFDNPAETKPLLHLWSLAIEEQFYLFWPLILIYIFKPVKKILIPIGVLIAASLSYSIWKIGVDAVGDFYSLLTRFWELLVGGFLACALVQAPDFANQYKKHISLLGLVLLVAGAVLINRQSAFPGAWALLPVLGAAALILSQGSFVNQKILSHPVLVGVGLISYPLYLWHWPLLSFARIFKGGTPDVAVRVELVVASFLLAWLTYQYVEKPIRTGGPSKTKVMALSLLMVVVFSVSFYIKTNHGFSFRQFGKLNGDASTMVIGADRGTHKHVCGIEHVPDINMEWCIQDNKLPHPNYAVLGDSKGEALYYGLSRESGPDQSWMMIGPVNFLTGYSNGLAKLAMDRIVGDSQIKTVVLGNALRGYTGLNQTTGFIDHEVSEQKIQTWVDAYTQAIQAFEAAGKQVVFVIDNPTFPDPNSCIDGDMTPIPALNYFIYRNANAYCQIRYSDHVKGTAPYQEFLQRLKANNPKLQIIDPTPLLCDIPNDTCSVLEGNNFLYSYGDHISDFASSKVAKKLLLALSKQPN
jgi:peptidoglycan/LPS O-acetylase OafA/YrhL